MRLGAVLAATVAVGAALVSCSAGGSPQASSTPTQAACALPMEPGSHTVELESGGVSRPFTLYVPAGYDGHSRIPVVVNGHGSTSTGDEQLGMSGMKPIADKNGFAVAAPNGAVQFTRGYIWNFPGFPLYGGTDLAPAGTPDDNLMVRDLIARVQDVVCTDASRVYATGFSAGGRAASYLACHNADLVAAIGAVGGLRTGFEPNQDDCEPSHPMPVIAFHGDADPINKYTGGTGTATNWGYGIQSAVDQWASMDGCDPTPARDTVTPTVDRQTFSGCKDGVEVVFYTVKGGGHTWPGATFPLPAEQFGATDMSINASQLMWDFFSQYSLPQ